MRPVHKRKRKHRDREEEAQLDEEDLDLIGEQFGERPKPQTQVNFPLPYLNYHDLVAPPDFVFSQSSSASSVATATKKGEANAVA